MVTDVAARGIDIPNLDYVINFHFPGSPKLFVHRVGRCARAGRTGTAFSLFSNEDAAHLLDLQIFLGRSFDINDNTTFGIIPSDLLEEEYMDVQKHMNDINIVGVSISSNDKNFIINTEVFLIIEWCIPYQSKCLQKIFNIKTGGINRIQCMRKKDEILFLTSIG